MEFINILLLTTFYEKPSQVWAFLSNHKYIHMIFYMGLFFLLIFIFYLVLYKKLNLKINISSYVAFSFFSFVFCLYIYGFCLLYDRCKEPFYMDDLLLFSYYKYVFFSCLTILFSFFWVLKFYVPQVKYFLDLVTYPYVKEELRIILHNWHEQLFAPICSFFYKKIYTSPFFSKLYFFFHWVLFYFVRLLIACFFVNFTLFHGDLRWLFYFMPVSFIIWLLSFFDYYFDDFRKGTQEFLAEILYVEYKKDLTPLESKQGFVFTDISNFNFTLLPEGLKEGFSLHDLEFLKSKWHISATVKTKFDSYQNSLYFFKLFILGSLCFCWFKISYDFLFNDTSSIILTFPFLFRRSLGFNSKQVFILRTPREVWFVKEGSSMNFVKK